MFNRRNLFATALIITAIMASLSYASFVGVTPGFPLLVYDSQGALGYDSTTGALSINSMPLAIRFSPITPPRFVSGVRAVTVGIQVDNTGALVGGIEGDDLVIEGDVDYDGDGTIDFLGVLLTGDIAQFGSLDSGGPTDQFDFRFQVTGGELAGFFIAKDIGVILQSENSSFTGDFAVDFSGGAKGVLGPIEAVCSLDATIEGCVIIPPEPDDISDCKGKLISMTLEYTGLGCDANSNSQDAKKAKCSGDPALQEPVSIVISNKKGKRIWASETGVNIGDTILVEASHGKGKRHGKKHRWDKKKRIGPNIKATIFNAAGDKIQKVKFHTSCSQPLNVGDQFGALRIVSLTSTKGGEVTQAPQPEEPNDICVTELPSAGPYTVEYTYTIINDSAVYPLINVNAVDNVIGLIPGSPIPLIAPGETATLTATTVISQETTNTVIVTGTVGGTIQCEAIAETTITQVVEPNEPVLEECTSKIKAMLLKYTGPDILDATVTIIADSFAGNPVAYTGINLTNGTILSSPSENGFTIDASAHDQTDLGPKTTIIIDSAKEVIHTSCSTPFIRQAPAPLNEPKGDPSTNWFVMEFTQKD